MRRIFFLLCCCVSWPASAVDFYWYHWGSPSVHYSSAQAACDTNVDSANELNSLSINSSGLILTCQYKRKSDGYLYTSQFDRGGDACTAPAVWDNATGTCKAPKVCPTTPLASLVPCTLSGGLYATPAAVCVDGCKFIPATGGSFKPYPDYDDPAETFCAALYQGTGEDCTGDPSIPDVPPEQTAEPPANPDENTPPTCMTYGVNEFCQDAQQPNCGTLNGIAYCNTESDKCGTVNGVFMCIPKSGSRECTYANGSYECIDPNTDTKIPHNSSDHPDNGGNADGNPYNDPQPATANATPEGSAQSGGGGATNESIEELKGAMEDGFDDITDILKKETPLGDKTLTAPVAEKGDLSGAEWDDKIEEAKTALKAKLGQFQQQISAANDWSIDGSGGGLPCIRTDVMDVCFSDYEEYLIGIRDVLIFLAYIIAAFIVFSPSRD